MRDLERDIVESLQEFNEKLKSGEPIQATRLHTCETCNGLGHGFDEGMCWRCGGKGAWREPVSL